MPDILESDALKLYNALPSASEEDAAKISDILSDYSNQQKERGQPLWPTSSQRPQGEYRFPGLDEETPLQVQPQASTLGDIGTALKAKAGGAAGAGLGGWGGAALGAEIGAAGGPLAPVTVPVGALIGGIAGSLLGGAVGEKGTEAALGAEGYQKLQEELQKARETSPFATGMTEMGLDLAPMIAAGRIPSIGAARAATLGKEAAALAQEANAARAAGNEAEYAEKMLEAQAKTTAAQEAAKAAEAASKTVGGRLAGAAEAGAVMGAAKEAEKQVREGEFKPLDLITSPIEEAVKFAPVGFIPNIPIARGFFEKMAEKALGDAARGTLVGGIEGLGLDEVKEEAVKKFGEQAADMLGHVLVKPIADSAVMTLTNDLYDNIFHGKPLDLNNYKTETGQAIPGFVVMNALTSLLHLPSTRRAAAEFKQQVIDANELREARTGEAKIQSAIDDIINAPDDQRFKVAADHIEKGVMPVDRMTKGFQDAIASHGVDLNDPKAVADFLRNPPKAEEVPHPDLDEKEKKANEDIARAEASKNAAVAAGSSDDLIKTIQGTIDGANADLASFQEERDRRNAEAQAQAEQRKAAYAELMGKPLVEPSAPKPTMGGMKAADFVDQQGIHTTPDLRTFALGEAKGKPHSDKYDGEVQKNIVDHPDQPMFKGGESFEHAATRVGLGVQKILDEAPSGSAIVTHNTVFNLIKELNDAGAFSGEKSLADVIADKPFREKYSKMDSKTGDSFQIKIGDKTINIARHGETVDNAAKVFRRNNADLTDKGIKQAADLSKSIGVGTGVKPEVYSSDLPRAVHTGKIIRGEAYEHYRVPENDDQAALDRAKPDIIARGGGDPKLADLDKFQKDLQEQLQKPEDKGGGGLTPQEAARVAAEHVRRLEALQNVAESVFGKNVVLVEPAKDGGRLGFEGCIYTPDVKTMFINTRSAKAPMAVFGHEFMHFIEKAEPKLMERFIDSVKKGGLLGLSKDELKEYFKATKQGYEEGKRLNEAIFNAVGDRFMDEDFLRRLADRNPDLFGELANVFHGWIKDVLEKIKKAANYLTGKELFKTDDVQAIQKRLEAFDKQIVELLNEYAIRKRAAEEVGAQPRRTEGVRPEKGKALGRREPRAKVAPTGAPDTGVGEGNEKVIAPVLPLSKNAEEPTTLSYSLTPKENIPTEENKGIGYRALRLINGKLYPAMIGDRPVPFGRWITAEYGMPHSFSYGKKAEGVPISKFDDIPEDAENLWVKSAQGGELAYRPGWHLGDVPSAIQFLVANKTKFPSNMVFVETQYDATHDYDKSPEFSKDFKIAKAIKENQLRSLPEDGFYRYKTNPDPATMAWIITDKINHVRVLSDDEVKSLVDDWNNQRIGSNVERAGFYPREDGSILTNEKAEELTKQMIEAGEKPEGIRKQRRGEIQETIPAVRIPGKGYDLKEGRVVKRGEYAETPMSLAAEEAREGEPEVSFSVTPAEDAANNVIRNDQDTIRKELSEGLRSVYQSIPQEMRPFYKAVEEEYHQNKDAAAALVNEFMEITKGDAKDFRPPSAREEALMFMRRIDLKNRIKKNSGNPLITEPLLQELDNTNQVLMRSGSKSAFSLRMRRDIFNEDYSYEGLLQKAIDKGIVPTEEYKGQLKKLSDDLRKNEDRQEEIERQKGAREAEENANSHIAELNKEAERSEKSAAEVIDEYVQSLPDAIKDDVEKFLDLVHLEKLYHQALESRIKGENVEFSLAKIEGEKGNLAKRLNSMSPDEIKKELENITNEREAIGNRIGKNIKSTKPKKGGPSDSDVEKAIKEVSDKGKDASDYAKSILKNLTKTREAKVKDATETTKDKIKRRVAAEVRKVGDPKKFSDDLKALGVDEATADGLYEAALNKNKERKAQGDRRRMDNESLGEEAPVEEDVRPLEDIVAGIKQKNPQTLQDLDRKDLLEAIDSMILNEGLKTHDQTIKRLHEIVKDAGVDVPLNDLRKYTYEYGKVRWPAQDELSKIRRTVRQVAIKTASKENVMAGEPPLMTGTHFGKPEMEVRDAQKDLMDAMKKYGVVPRTSRNQLTSLEERITNRLNNQIEELNAQIERGEKKIRDKTKPTYTAEQKKLVEQRDALKKQLDELTKKPDEDEATRNKRLLKIAQDNAERWRERSEKLDFEAKQKGGEPSQDVIDVRRTAEAAKEEFMQLREILRPDINYNSRLKARISNLERMRKNLDKKLLDKDLTPEERKFLEKKIKTLDATLKDLKDPKIQVTLKEALEVIKGDPDDATMQLEDRAKKAWGKLDAEIKDYLERIKQEPNDAKRQELQRELDIYKELRDSMLDVTKPSDEELAMAKFRRKLERREKFLNGKMADLQTGEYVKRPKAKTPDEEKLDKETQDLVIRTERTKREIDMLQEKALESQKSRVEKILDTLTKVKRLSVLSSPVTIAKMIITALSKTISGTAETLAGKGWQRLLPEDLVKKATLERSDLSLGNQARIIVNAMLDRGKMLKDAEDMYKTGVSDMDVLYSPKGKLKDESGVWGWFGRVHAMIKSPVKRARFETALAQLTEAYLKDGPPDAREQLMQDGSLVHFRLAQEAYKAANRSIFLDDNVVSDVFKSLVKSLENREDLPSKTLAAFMKILFPVVRVPTNIVKEAFQYTAGVPIGLGKLAAIYARGMETITKDEADSVLRLLKKGSIGGALALLGFYTNFAGGYYNPDDKRKIGDPNPGQYKIFGVTVPSWLTHAPAFEAIQFGASMRRALENTKHGTSLPASALAAAVGLADEVPFLKEMSEVKALKSEDGRSKFFNELARSEVEPLLIQKVAQWMDRNRPFEPSDILTGEGTQARDPKTLEEYLKSGIPMLRKDVPLKISGPFSPTDSEVPEIIQSYSLAGNPMPAKPVRGPLEKANPGLNQRQWEAYTIIRGDAIKQGMLQRMGQLMSPMMPEEKKKIISQIESEASHKAKGFIGLK